MITKEPSLVAGNNVASRRDGQRGALVVVRLGWQLIVLAAVALFAYSVAWNFSTRRYLTGFADAIIPLGGSPQQKTEALIEWFHNEPRRNDSPSSEVDGLLRGRDPVNIVQDKRLLRVCGTASNAFMNLAVASGLNVRRLLLLDRSGGTMHVVAEVQWGNRWIVVNPQQGLVFKDRAGRALTREELRNPDIFRDAISSMPGYDPMYTFDHTFHIRLERIPILGAQMRSFLDRFAPGWEESVNWSYLPENPALWVMFISVAMLFVGLLGWFLTNRRGRLPRKVYLEEPAH